MSLATRRNLVGKDGVHSAFSLSSEDVENLQNCIAFAFGQAEEERVECRYCISIYILISYIII